jgi:antibiotic biosynthesis monooxygenase (ABM) superfamily enzyme
MPIHVAITRKILPGKEDEFREALRHFLGESFVHDGVHGASIITSWPGADEKEIGILRTFADEAERDTFYKSKMFQDWEAYASTITEEPVYRQLTGLEAWFRSPKTPPRWKMAVLTLCGVYPTSLFLSLIVGPFIQQFPIGIRAFIISVCMVGLLTWVVMPLVIKVTRRWLQSS